MLFFSSVSKPVDRVTMEAACTRTKSPSSTLDARTTRNNVVVFRNDRDCSVVEILSSKNRDGDDDGVRTIESFCIHVEPRACSRVVKELSLTLPLEDRLSHLKRVRRQSSPLSTSAESISKSIAKGKDANGVNRNDASLVPKNPESSLATDRPKKRPKPNYLLEVLICTHLRLISKDQISVKDHPVVREFGPLHSVVVPKYEPRSEEEWKEHNSSWPTLYHPLKFEDFIKKQRALSESELRTMKKLMDLSIQTRSVFIVDPDIETPVMKEREKVINDDIDHRVVSTSRKEQSLQDQLSKQQQQQQHSGMEISLLQNNPLATPILLALQGVSRLERQRKMLVDGVAAINATSMESQCNKQHQERQHQYQPKTKRCQYICTGYDLYSFYEPNVFEAMACLHSRIRRLIYFVPNGQSSLCSGGGCSPNEKTPNRNVDNKSDVWRHGISNHAIHQLAGTNHNYRAFEYRQSSYTS